MNLLNILIDLYQVVKNYFNLIALLDGQTLIIEILYSLYGCIDIVLDTTKPCKINFKQFRTIVKLRNVVFQKKMSKKILKKRIYLFYVN